MRVAFTSAPPCDRGHELSRREPVEARPQTDVRRGRPLRLEPRDALDGLGHRQPVSPKQELPRERRAIQPPDGERSHGRDDSRRLVCRHLRGRRRTEDGPMRILLVVLLFACAGLLAVDIEPSASPRAVVSVPARTAIPKPAPETVEVAFVRMGWVVECSASCRRAPRPPSSRCASSRRVRPGRATQGNPHRTARSRAAALLRAGADTWFASFSRSTPRVRTAGTRSACGSGRSPPRSHPTGRGSTRCSQRKAAS